MSKLVSISMLSASAIGTIAVASTSCSSKHNNDAAIVVELDKNELELFVDDTEQLIATIVPENATNKKVSWESSNPNVATVDENGVVTAILSGKTTITVTTKDGKHQATCEVSVE